MAPSAVNGSALVRDGRQVRAAERRQATRELLVATARSVVRDEGVAATTLEHIGQRAGLSRATIYLHFATKADVLGAVLDDLVGRLEGAVLGVDLQDGAAPPEDQLAANLVRVLHVLFENQRLSQLLFALPVHDEPAITARAALFLASVRRMLREALTDGREVGLVRGQFDVDVATSALFGAVREVVCSAELGDSDDLDRRVAIAWSVVSVCLCGVASDELRAAVADSEAFFAHQAEVAASLVSVTP